MSTSTWREPARYTNDPNELRTVFNDSRIFERFRQGDQAIRRVLRRESHSDRPPPDHPLCTRSEIFAWFDDGALFALTHQYTLPDGAIGGAGLPDPKVVRHPAGGTLRYRPLDDEADLTDE